MSVVVALDFGVKKMGVAVGNTLTNTAEPNSILPMDNGKPNWENLLAFIKEWRVAHILVGLPLNIDGTDSHLSKRATKFAKRLNHKLKENHLNVTVHLVDERLSSHEARNQDVHEIIDDVAAMVFLKSWLNSQDSITLP